MEDIENEYIQLMMSGCMCENPNTEDIINRYESLGGTQQELVTKTIQRLSRINMIQINSGNLGYPVP